MATERFKVEPPGINPKDGWKLIKRMRLCCLDIWESPESPAKKKKEYKICISWSDDHGQDIYSRLKTIQEAELLYEGMFN